MPKTEDLPDIGAEVARKTLEAKTARITCLKSSSRLAQHKLSIEKAVVELKDETDKRKERLITCKATTASIKKQLDHMTSSISSPGKESETIEKHMKDIKILEERLAKEKKECAIQDFDEKKAEKNISDKRAEVKEIVRFIKETCADAASTESDVEEAIAMATQIEYTNRVYVQYIEYMQKLDEQEKIFEANQ
jgi:predicted  nucleic acid-binding Zn-ribbon protein